MKLEYLGEFATILENILMCEPIAEGERVNEKKLEFKDLMRLSFSKS
jgi:hypothetical protein